MTDDWDWYVGDPCYHISDDRWFEFCDHLKHPGDIYFYWPIYDEDGKEIDEVEIEVWDSPYGDGCWMFRNLIDQSLVKGYEIGVDAGIIAVLPREACEKNTDLTMGLYFKGCQPYLECREGSFEVKVNGVPHDDAEGE